MVFFESKDTEVFEAGRNKLFARNEKQTDNHTLMLDMLHSNMSVVCTYHCRGVFHEKYLHIHPNTSIHLLHTVLHIFPDVLGRRICLTIKRFFS